jgi:hypothetical protein
MEINEEQRNINNQETFNLSEIKCIINDQTGNLLNIPFLNYEKKYDIS